MDDNHKPNGGDGSDGNILVRIAGKHRNISRYINMGYMKMVLFCIYFCSVVFY